MENDPSALNEQLNRQSYCGVPVILLIFSVVLFIIGVVVAPIDEWTS